MKKNVFISGGASFNAVVTLDHFPAPSPQTIHHCMYDETIGNTGAGKALALSQLGFDTTLHSLLGDDMYSEKVKEALKKPDLNFIYDMDPNGTERHINILNAKGERISIFVNPSSDEPNIAYEDYSNMIERSEFVVINISNYCRHFLPICKTLNKKIWTDLHDYDGKNTYHDDFIEASDYIFLSSDNFEDYKSFMEQMIHKGKELVVCTHGGQGSTAFTKNKEWIYEPAIADFEMVNCNGAGDNYFAGFMYAFSKGESIRDCMRYGTISGGMCVSSKGLVSDHLSNINIEKEYIRYSK